MTETIPEGAQISDLIDNVFKTTVLNVLKRKHEQRSEKIKEMVYQLNRHKYRHIYKYL